MDGVKTLLRFTGSLLLALAIFLGRLGVVLLAIVPTGLVRLGERVRRAPAPLPSRAGRRPRVLFVGGTINHTTQVQQIAAELPECEATFTWYYCDGVLELGRRLGLLESTALGGSLYDLFAARWDKPTSFSALVLLGAACTAACWLLVPLLRVRGSEGRVQE